MWDLSARPPLIRPLRRRGRGCLYPDHGWKRGFCSPAIGGFRIEQVSRLAWFMQLETLVEETVMIAPYILPFTLRSLLDRVGVAPTLQGRGRRKGTRLARWQQMFVAFEDWLTASNLAWRGETLLGDQLEGFHHFCGDCGRDTPHDGFDELGSGWYTQISRCLRCGRQGMTVWPIAWW